MKSFWWYVRGEEKRVKDVTVKYTNILRMARRVGHGIPLQYSCLENPRDRGAWQPVVHAVARSQKTTGATEYACTMAYHLYF